MSFLAQRGLFGEPADTDQDSATTGVKPLSATHGPETTPGGVKGQRRSARGSCRCGALFPAGWFHCAGTDCHGSFASLAEYDRHLDRCAGTTQ